MIVDYVFDLTEGLTTINCGNYANYLEVTKRNKRESV